MLTCARVCPLGRLLLCQASRFSWGANVTAFDMWDSYLPQYKIAFTGKGRPSGAMCSYFAANGVRVASRSISSRWGVDPISFGSHVQCTPHVGPQHVW